MASAPSAPESAVPTAAYVPSHMPSGAQRPDFYRYTQLHFPSSPSSSSAPFVCVGSLRDGPCSDWVNACYPSRWDYPREVPWETVRDLREGEGDGREGRRLGTLPWVGYGSVADACRLVEFGETEGEERRARAAAALSASGLFNDSAWSIDDVRNCILLAPGEYQTFVGFHACALLPSIETAAALLAAVNESDRKRMEALEGGVDFNQLPERSIIGYEASLPASYNSAPHYDQLVLRPSHWGIEWGGARGWFFPGTGGRFPDLVFYESRATGDLYKEGTEERLPPFPYKTNRPKEKALYPLAVLLNGTNKVAHYRLKGGREDLWSEHVKTLCRVNEQLVELVSNDPVRHEYLRRQRREKKEQEPSLSPTLTASSPPPPLTASPPFPSSPRSQPPSPPLSPSDSLYTHLLHLSLLAPFGPYDLGYISLDHTRPFGPDADEALSDLVNFTEDGPVGYYGEWVEGIPASERREIERVLLGRGQCRDPTIAAAARTRDWLEGVQPADEEDDHSRKRPFQD